MKLRRILTAVTVLACIGLLGLLPVTAQDDGEPITLRYADWDVATEDLIEQIVDICAAQLGLEVQFELYNPPGDVYWPTLQTMAAAQNLPDVFAMSSAFLDEWAADGLVMNIQEYVDRDIMPVADDYFVGAFDQARFPSKVDGDLHAFPYAFVHTVLYYNMDMFDEAGLDYPSEGWTWDDFLEAAIALTLGDDQYGFWFYGRYAQIEPWIYQNNGRLLSADKTRFEPDDNAIEALEFLVSLVEEYGVAPEPADMEGIRQQDVFPLGLAAMWVDGSWNINNNRTQIGDGDTRWGLAPIPRGPNWVEDTAFGWPDLLAVSPFSPHPDEAWELVRCITGPDRTLELTDQGKIAIYQPISQTEEFLEPDLMPVNKEFLLDWAQYIGPNSFTPGWGEWRGYVGGAGMEGQITEVLNGNITLEQALEDITQLANEVLGRFYP
jgi:multiple sugar transport system substrate-binding protein